MAKASAPSPRIGISAKSSGLNPRSFAGYALFIPAIVLVVLFKVVPLLVGVGTSLTTPRGVFASEFVGLDNYRRLLEDDVWIGSFVNLAKLLVGLPIFVLVPLLLSVPLYLGIRGWRFFRAVFFLSWLLPPVAVGLMFNPIFGIDGPVNEILGAFGFKPILFLGRPEYALWTLGGVILWSWFGLGTAIYLAGLSTLHTELLDSARIDGAGRWPIFRWVMFPHLRPTIAYWTVLCTASMMLGLFGFVFALTEGGPAGATMLPEYRIWDFATRYTFQPGLTSAMGVMLFAVVAFVTLIQVRTMFLSRDRE